ncbi:hypothetical protein [Lysobacter hankyongensis]|uniref:DUF2721 domain-containing protein n=1 Tax=Lysobacter hankyongensis TaxID=1176535 RepID=A0ABP9C8B3_9GAMM
MQFIEWLAALDSTLTAALAATLAGMSLTAASLLANLVKNQVERAEKIRDSFKKQKESWDDGELDGSAKKDASKKIILKYKNQYELAQQGDKALNSVLLAFGAFAVNLVESIAFDPSVEASLGVETRHIKESLAVNYPILIDVGISATTMAIGIGLLIRAAFKINKVGAEQVKILKSPESLD